MSRRRKQRQRGQGICMRRPHSCKPAIPVSQMIQFILIVGVQLTLSKMLGSLSVYAPGKLTSSLASGAPVPLPVISSCEQEGKNSVMPVVACNSSQSDYSIYFDHEGLTYTVGTSHVDNLVSHQIVSCLQIRWDGDIRWGACHEVGLIPSGLSGLLAKLGDLEPFRLGAIERGASSASARCHVSEDGAGVVKPLSARVSLPFIRGGGCNVPIGRAASWSSSKFSIRSLLPQSRLGSPWSRSSHSSATDSSRPSQASMY